MFVVKQMSVQTSMLAQNNTERAEPNFFNVAMKPPTTSRYVLTHTQKEVKAQHKDCVEAKPVTIYQRKLFDDTASVRIANLWDWYYLVCGHMVTTI